ncbi:MAG: nucleoside triphosphate pyrophosphohydrolase [Myxococcales bacterium]|nr:nucleoside triphosphate pyrophosphohydrolase [Myxococcales bacterium]
MAALRAVDGCPWDREQSLASLRAYLIEEAHELLDAIAALGPAAQATAGEPPQRPPQPAIDQLREELGDVLLQVAFQSQIAHEYGWFNLDSVADAIAAKMIRRHPHVFEADAQVASAGEVRDRWEQQKRKEGKGALDGVPRNLPALLRAQRMADKAARIGFDWPDAAAVWPKVHEELAELQHAWEQGDRPAMQEELGDALFAVANLARHLGLDAELSLRDALDKFSTRFGHVERAVTERHGAQHRADADELEQLWQQAKALERGGSH